MGEPNNPKTGTIAFYTVSSLILLLVSMLALEGLFHIWEGRAEQKLEAVDYPSDVSIYRKEQNARLEGLAESMKQVIEDAKAGKNLAAPAPPPAKTPEKTPGKAGEKTPEKKGEQPPEKKTT
jgi:hypothetical protein